MEIETELKNICNGINTTDKKGDKINILCNNEKLAGNLNIFKQDGLLYCEDCYLKNNTPKNIRNYIQLKEEWFNKPKIN